MKITTSLLPTLILTTICSSVLAEPPRPPLGKKWILNETFSDEFNGTELDKSKWFDYHPSWAGREPGIFMPSQISVQDGLMRIKGEKLKQDKVITSADIVTQEGTERTYSIAGGAVISKTETAYFGYYESRFKAAKTTMSTTFWLATRNWDFPGPKPCNDRYGLELDIQESIGRGGDFNGKVFAKGMHANGHFWYADCDGKMQDLRSPKVTFKSDNLASDSFNTYGGWWHNESSASFYYNNSAPKFMRFYSEVKDKPFDQPMGVNLVSETYPFPWVELPNDQELADPAKNVAYYDWVRAYLLVDAKHEQTDKNISRSNPLIYTESITINPTSVALIDNKNIEFLMEYKTNQARLLQIELRNAQGQVIAKSDITVQPGYAFLPYQLASRTKLSEHEQYSIYTSIKPLTSNKNSDVLFSQWVNLANFNTINDLETKLNNLTNIELTDDHSLIIPMEQGVFHYSIFNQGKKLNLTQQMQGITYNNSLDVKGLAKGSYFLQLDGEWVAKFEKTTLAK
ncbi:beta-porphyranase D [Paraglaciecola aquimarina]|uniref:Beta-porphyranase D n=1 Tax=Paraglaciecola algarum TaxID=3050085 RepID=A0ABS9D1M1_9ALTE|nr:beta-porphyranase D [Paraglaciecola sp. G1-23]MCF2946814.1 beta-porphyranase D [Paraglaciecola sp. G1-23]